MVKTKLFVVSTDEGLEERINKELKDLQFVRHEIMQVQVMPKATQLRVIITYKSWE